MPSICSVGRVLQLPSKANLSGAPVSRTFTPERSPASAAAKSLIVIEVSIGSPCQTTWPVAAKLLEIDGQASASSTPWNVSSMPRAASLTAMVPSSMRISVNEVASTGRLAFGPSARASVVDHRRPVGTAVVIEADVDARAHQRYVGDLDAPGEQREETQPRRELVGLDRRLGVAAERHIGEADRAGRKQRNRDVAAQHEIEPGDVADFGFGGLAHPVDWDQQRDRRPMRQGSPARRRQRRSPSA